MESPEFEPSLGQSTTGKLAVNPAVNGTYDESGEDRAIRRGGWRRLLYVTYSRPLTNCPYVLLGYRRSLPSYFLGISGLRNEH